jgi:hypothetical protein
MSGPGVMKSRIEAIEYPARIEESGKKSMFAA